MIAIGAQFHRFVLFAFLGLVAPTVSPQALEIFSAGQAVSGIVAELQSSIEQIIKTLEGAYSKSAFDTRSHAVALLQQIQLSGEALVGKSFGELDKSQKAIFTNVRITIDDWNKGNRAALDKLGVLVSGINGALATIPLSKTWPRVLRYAPSYVVQTASDASFDVSVQGVWLGEGSPKLLFSNKSCDLTSKTEDQLRFRCPRSVFGDQKRLQMVSGKLTVEYASDGLLERAKQFFGQGKVRTYDIAIAVVPSGLGAFAGTATVSRQSQRTGDRAEHCSRHNGHCEGPYPLTCNMTAKAGWQIDVNSVSAGATNRSSDSSFDGVYSKTTNGFQLRATVRNSGSCGPKVPFTDERIGYDARGMIALTATWKETIVETIQEPVQLSPGTLNWGSEVSIALPPESTGVHLTILRADGKSEVVTGTKLNGWVTAEFRPDLRTLVLRPSAPSIAFAD